MYKEYPRPSHALVDQPESNPRTWHCWTMTSIMTIDSSMFRNPTATLLSISRARRSAIRGWLFIAEEGPFWTGKRPEHVECPGVAEDGHMTSLPLPDVSEVRSRLPYMYIKLSMQWGGVWIKTHRFLVCRCLRGIKRTPPRDFLFEKSSG